MLRAGEISLYLANVPGKKQFADMDLSPLEPHELAQAGRFIREQKQRGFLASRIMRRHLLAKVLETAPEELRFSHGEYGKPFLCGQHENKSVFFNLSHSGEKILLGIGNAPLGVDIEIMRDNMDYLRFADRFFSDKERVDLGNLPLADHRQAFFNGWTRKEAFMKAKGCGLTLGLNKFDVNIGAGEENALLATYYDVRDQRQWWLQGVEVGNNYRAAVAYEGSGQHIRLNSYDLQA